jgi:hypothetical protein
MTQICGLGQCLYAWLPHSAAQFPSMHAGHWARRLRSGENGWVAQGNLAHGTAVRNFVDGEYDFKTHTHTHIYILYTYNIDIRILLYIIMLSTYCN